MCMFMDDLQVNLTYSAPVNNVGWNYSLQGTESRVERLRLMRRDSTRNLLALNYIGEFLSMLFMSS